MPKQNDNYTFNTDQNLTGLKQIRSLIHAYLADDSDFVPLLGLKTRSLENSPSHKVFFAVSCHCTTNAVLSVEVDRAKTIEQVKEALPALKQQLYRQASKFNELPCEMHLKMRVGARSFPSQVIPPQIPTPTNTTNRGEND